MILRLIFFNGEGKNNFGKNSHEKYKNMDSNYFFHYEKNKKIYEQNILKETKNLVGYIYYNYWANEQEKKSFKNIVVNNSI